jgi:hypothetical protein
MLTPTITNLEGTPGSYATIAAAGSVTVSLALGAGVGVATNILTGSLEVEVVIGPTPPSTNPLVQFTYSDDGTKYYNDRGPYIAGAIGVPAGQVANGSYDYVYNAPAMGVQAIAVTISNPGNEPITVLVQGVTVVQS